MSDYLIPATKFPENKETPDWIQKSITKGAANPRDEEGPEYVGYPVVLDTKRQAVIDAAMEWEAGWCGRWQDDHLRLAAAVRALREAEAGK